MRYNTLGRTGLFVSELCFGSMTFGGNGGIWEKIGQTPQQEADALGHDGERGGKSIERIRPAGSNPQPRISRGSRPVS